MLLKFVPVKTPWVFRKLFPYYVWDVKTKEKVIYLTFDDGPTPQVTNFVLDTLKAYEAKASFFCIGNNVEQHPEIFNRVIEEDHAIGNHTQNHVRGWRTKTQAYLQNVAEAERSIQQSSIPNPQSPISNLFRPPYGQIKPSQGKQLMQLGYKIIMWDVISFDWDKAISEENCLQNVISKTESGSIVVFHDSVKASKNMMYALPKVLEYFSEKGFRFESLKKD